MSANKIRQQKQAKRSSKAAAKTARKTTAAKRKAARKAYDFAKLYKAAISDGSTSYAVPSGAKNPSRAGIGSHDRPSDGAEQSTKARVFSHVVDTLAKSSSVDVKALAKKFPAVQESTIRSWLGNWKRGLAGGALFPSVANDIGAAVCEKRLAKLRG